MTHLVSKDSRQVDAELGGCSGEAQEMPIAAATDGRLKTKLVLTVDGVAQ